MAFISTKKIVDIFAAFREFLQQCFCCHSEVFWRDFLQHSEICFGEGATFSDLAAFSIGFEEDNTAHLKVFTLMFSCNFCILILLLKSCWNSVLNWISEKASEFSLEDFWVSAILHFPVAGLLKKKILGFTAKILWRIFLLLDYRKISRFALKEIWVFLLSTFSAAEINSALYLKEKKNFCCFLQFWNHSAAFCDSGISLLSAVKNKK